MRRDTGRLLLQVGVVVATTWAGAAWATPLPPSDASGAPTLSPGEAASVYSGMRLVVGLVLGALVLSVAANFYMAWTVNRYHETVVRLVQGMAALHESHAAMREVAHYWLERRAERLAREDEEIHAASRFPVIPQRRDEDEEGGTP